jgi:hypothetical protein
VSIFSDPVIVRLLKTRFIPVAVDQHDQRRRKDAEGQFFARILKQAGRGLDGYSQGFYLFTPAGTLLEFDNTLSGQRMKTMLASALKKFDPSVPVPRIEERPKARRLLYQGPEGGLVVRVQAKVLGGYGKNKTGSAVYENSLGTDHLWIRKDEAGQLAKGTLPKSVQVRLVRFHLVDNTRGEPPFWQEGEIKHLDMTLARGQLTGVVRLETKAGDRGFHARLRGVLEVNAGKVTRLDLVARGEFWGEGTYTRGAPKGKFPFAVAFTLSPGKGNDSQVPPGGARGNLQGYLR